MSAPATQTLALYSSSSQPGNGLKAGASFLGRFLGIEGSVSPEHKMLMSFSSTGTELDLGEKIYFWIYEEQS